MYLYQNPQPLSPPQDPSVTSIKESKLIWCHPIKLRNKQQNKAHNKQKQLNKINIPNALCFSITCCNKVNTFIIAM